MSAASPAPARLTRTRALRLNFNEQRELAALPGRIEALEIATAELSGRFANAAVYREGTAAVKALQDELDLLDAELTAAYARWEVLESRNGTHAATGDR